MASGASGAACALPLRSRLRVSPDAAVFPAGLAAGSFFAAFGAGVAAAGVCSAITGVGFSTAACFGVDAPHAASSAAQVAATPPRTARRETCSADGFDKGLSYLRFRITSGIQLDERREASLHPLVVQA